MKRCIHNDNSHKEENKHTFTDRFVSVFSFNILSRNMYQIWEEGPYMKKPYVDMRSALSQS